VVVRDAAHLAVFTMDFLDLTAVVDVYAGCSGDVVDQRTAVFVEYLSQKP